MLEIIRFEDQSGEIRMAVMRKGETQKQAERRLNTKLVLGVLGYSKPGFTEHVEPLVRTPQRELEFNDLLNALEQGKLTPLAFNRWMHTSRFTAEIKCIIDNYSGARRIPAHAIH